MERPDYASIEIILKRTLDGYALREALEGLDHARAVEQTLERVTSRLEENKAYAEEQGAQARAQNDDYSLAFYDAKLNMADELLSIAKPLQDQDPENVKAEK